MTLPPAFKRFLVALAGFLGAAALVGITAQEVRWRKPHIKYPLHPKTVPDPSAVIGTFVTVYGLFIGVFGVLAGFLVTKRAEGWRLGVKAFALTLLFAATVADLVLVLLASNDLFKGAKHQFSYPALNDDVLDFQIYFGLNLLAGVISILALALLPDSAGTTVQLEARKQES